MHAGAAKTAVILLNMGGPDSLEAVQPFLKNLFSDPAIIGMPGLLRGPMSSYLSRKRARKVQPRYALIGGKSPIGEITSRQASALSRELSGAGLDITAAMPAFSYWHPFIADSVSSAQRSGAEKLVALSLYPQFCGATTGTCLEDLSRYLPGTPFETQTSIIDSWPDHPGYLDAVAGTVREALSRIPPDRRDDSLILFSAHGVPQALIRKGDPYLEETLRTVKGVADRLDGRAWDLAFQSRLGPVKWVEPNLKDKLSELAGRGAPPLVVVPVSFVSDHIETLYELDIQHREIAEDLGFSTFERAPSLNTRPDFIRAMAELVVKELSMERPS